MDFDSNSSASAGCSPVGPSRRMAVASLLNTDEVNISFTSTNGSISQQREVSEPVDSPVEMSMEPGSPDSEDCDEVDSKLDGSRGSGRSAANQARQRKKQWTHEQVRKLQVLYKQDLGWEEIAKALGRSPVACKLKHNKELRRKAPIVMALPGREPMHSSHGPQQLVNDALGAIASVRQHLHDHQATVVPRINEHIEQAFNAFARQYEDHAKRTGGDCAASIDHLQQTLAWEVSAAIAREQQYLSEAWSAVVRLQSQASVSPQVHPIGPPHRY